MKDIEDDAKRVLTPLITTTTAQELDISGQTAAALWACKCAILARYQHLTPEPVDRGWLNEIYLTKKAIRDWNVWLGAYNGSLPFGYFAHDITFHQVTGEALSGRRTTHGVLATIVAGYLVAQVLGLHEGQVDDINDNGSIRIWPVAQSVASWPPQAWLDDTTLPVFADRILSNPVRVSLLK